VPVAKVKAKQTFVDPDRGSLASPRFILGIILVVLGIAWIVYYYTVVRVDPTVLPAPAAGSPAFMADLEKWNYAIGFGLILLGLLISANPSTPLGRGRGVVVGMLTCFLFGLLWICTFYVLSGDQLPHVPIFNDLGQYNLMVGIGFMAVGFAFATRWE
jgi:drug/metabolite transporter (DMT)-like permease